MSATVEEVAPVERIRAAFGERLVDPAAAEYDEARRLHNGLIDLRPALIARCRGVADVADALAFARESGLQIAVRGGGHSIAGYSSIEDGIVIDLSLMKGIH